MAKVFRIRNTDLRQQFLDRFQRYNMAVQKTGGQDIEVFHPNYGFLLLRDEKDLNWDTKQANQVWAVAQLSMGPMLSLREFYYTLRGKPNLVEPFSDTKNVYESILSSINNLEIMCDIDREHFVMGRNPSGAVFYGHSMTYGNPEKLIGLTEDLASTYLEDYAVSHAMNIVHMEKMSAANRLINSDFSRLTNSVITTTGGNFTRAVYKLAARFHDQKNMTFFCDGDAYGNDMLRTLEYGSKNSRHLTPDQAFPEKRHPGIHVAGFFPSIGERLEIPNDLEAKRPMSNKYVRERIRFLQRYGLVDDRDLATWKNNKTYELEALSSSFTDSNGNPVGLMIYLVEYWRILGLPLKPQPTSDNDTLKRAFDREAQWTFETSIRNAIQRNSPKEALQEYIEESFSRVEDTMIDAVIEKYQEEFSELLKNQDADNIRQHLLLQYEERPRREMYSIGELTNRLIRQIYLKIQWNTEKLKEDINDLVDEYLEDYINDRDTDDLLEKETAKFEDLPEADEPSDFYDIVEDELGCKPEDCRQIREALEWRLE